MSTHPTHQVLIVEDHDDIREAFTTVLRVNGFDVAPACGVEDALRQLRQGFRPCIVFLDLQMPGMDGWAFWDRMRIEPHLMDVPVVIVSAQDDQRAGAKERGVCEFLLKPADPAAVVAVVHRHCRRRDS